MKIKEQTTMKKILIEAIVPTEEPYQTIYLGRIYEQLITQGMSVNAVYDYHEIMGKLEIVILNDIADVIEKHRNIVEKALNDS